jgi:hypothetical protein
VVDLQKYYKHTYALSKKPIISLSALLKPEKMLTEKSINQFDYLQGVFP